MAQEVEVHVIGMMHMQGESKKSGAPYEFAQIEYLRTVTPHFKNNNMEAKKAGFEVVTIGIDKDPQTWNEFLKMPFNSRVTLVLAPDPNDISKSMCIAWKPSASLKDKLQKAG